MATISVPDTLIKNHSEEEVLRLLLYMLEDARRHGSPETYEVRVLEDSIDLLQALISHKYKNTDPTFVI